MAFSDLCKISNAYKAVENEPDQSERIMEENSMVRDLITKILDDAGPTEGQSSTKPPEKALGIGLPTIQYPKTSGTNTSFVPPATSYNTYQDTSLYNFPQNDQSSFNFNIQNGFGSSNGFVNYDNDVNNLLGIEPVADPTSDVTPEQLNLLRLAAQEIGGAQFTSPNSNDKYYNFFEPSQRNSLPDTNMFLNNNFNRPNSLNLDSLNFNSNLLDSNPYNGNNMQRFPNKFSENFLKESQNGQDPTDILAYLNQLNMSLERPRDDVMMQNNMTDFKMPLDMNGHFQNEEHFNKMAEGKMFNFNNRNFQQMPPNKNFNGDNNFYLNEMMKSMTNGDNKNFQMNQNFEYQNQTQIPNANFKPNGFHQNDFVHRNQMIQRDNFQNNGALNDQQRMNIENPLQRDGMQQAAMMRQNQELARQMSLLMRNRPPPNQLNVDVSFLHENAPFNLGLGALLGPSPTVPPPVLPSPMLDLPLLAPFYAMRNMRTAHTSSAILHARLDACYEQWRQLERERKRTEAKLALAYPGRAVSSSNSIPVPRLPPCPTRVDRLTVDMLREHTKVLTLMGKMETLRASVCVAQNKRPHKDAKITVLKRGQENIPDNKEKEGIDPATFQPSTWKEDVSCLHEIAPHSEVESAMLSWRSAVAAVQAARRRELAPHNDRFVRSDPILQLADAVKQLGISARRARCAMWCDLTLTVALAPEPTVSNVGVTEANTQGKTSTTNDKSQQSSTSASPKQPAQETANNGAIQNNAAAKLVNTDTKEEKSATDSSTTNPETEPAETTTDKTANKQPEKPDQKVNQQRRQQNYRHKLNQPGRSNDFYQRNQRYDNRFMHSRHPYHYLATGPIN